MDDPIYALVHALDPDEVTFVKKFVPPDHKNAPVHAMALFKFLLKQKHYDKGTTNAKFPKDLRKHRSVLKDYILKCMRLKRDATSRRALVAAHLSNYEFLYEKGLYEASMKSLLKAKKIAKEYQFNGLLIDIVNLEKHRLLEMHKQDLVEIILEKNLEKHSLLSRYKVEMEAASEYHEVMSLFRKGGKSVAEIPILVGNRDKVIGQTDLDETFFTRLYRYSTVVIASMVSLDEGRALGGLEAIVKHWNAYPAIKSMYPTKYRISLYNYAAQCIKSGKMEEAKGLIGEFEDLPSSNFNQKAEKFQSLAYLRVIYAIESLHIPDVLEIASMVEKGLATYQDKINKSREFTIKHNLVQLLVLDESYKEALKWVRSILAEKKYAIRKEIVNDARLILLIIYWELDQKEVLSHEITAYYQYLHKNDFLNDYTKVMVHHFKKLLNALSLAEEKEVFQNLKDELMDQLATREYAALGYSLVLHWADHKISGLPIREAAREYEHSLAQEG